VDVRSKIAKIRQVSNETKGGLRLWRLGDNESCLMRFVLPEETVAVWLVRQGGRRVLVDSPEGHADVRYTWLFPVFVRPGGWQVLAGTVSRNSLVSRILHLIEKKGSDDVILYVERKGRGLETTYEVHVASEFVPDHEILSFRQELAQAPPPPTSEEMLEVARRIFRGGATEDGEES